MRHPEPSKRYSPTVKYILFPGRHHVLTSFQAQYLRALAAGKKTDATGTPIHMDPQPIVIFAVTSWDHAGTRRNPLPGHRREAAIERFASITGLDHIVVPVLNVPPTHRFADVLLNAVSVSSRSAIELTSDNTVLASSTPELIDLFEPKGFQIATVELDAAAGERIQRPWELVETIAATGSTNAISGLLHPASTRILSRYNLTEEIVELFADPLLGDEGDITETRDYASYQASFDGGAERKFALVAEHIRPGRIVDIGCGSGSLLQQLAQAPSLAESDLFGIEASRHLYEVCVHRRNMGGFDNQNTFFHHRNVLRTPVLAKDSVDTTITMALTHEVWSYVGPHDVHAMADAIFTHTRGGGRWINADVCGPDDPDEIVEFELDTLDGADDTDPTPTSKLDDATAYLDGLSTWGLWHRFVRDFRAHEGETISWTQVAPGTGQCRRGSLYEFLTKKDYHDSWLSEMHESFCHYTFADWRSIAETAGFVIDPASHSYSNEWIVEHRMTPVCTVRTLDGAPDPIGITHLVLVATKPSSPTPI